MYFKEFYHILLLTAIHCECANILGIINFPCKSHHILGETLLKALASRNHEVTMLSPFVSKNTPKNYKDVVVPELIQREEDRRTKSMIDNHNSFALWKMTDTVNNVNVLQDIFFNSTVTQKLIKSRLQYDLAIVTYFGNDAILALAHHSAKHTIILNTLGSNYWITKITKAPASISYVPTLFSTLSNNLSFLDRTYNLFFNIFTKIFDAITEQKNQHIIDIHFPNAPSIRTIRNNVSLVLINSNYGLESPRPYVPNMVQVGGLHIEDPQPLGKELDEFMNDATNGVIFFSLGSTFQASELDDTIVRSIIKCFSKLPYNVLWKFEKTIRNLPENVKINKWLPQRDILGHPKLKLFITHGGLLSVTEALYHGVPMIGIPMYADQEGNSINAADNGYLVKLSFTDLSDESLTNAVMEVMSNASYVESAKNTSRIFRDQPMRPIDKAIYWVEYVLRHNGAHHLKTGAVKLNVFEEYLLDVLFVFGIALFIVVYVLKLLVKFVCKILNVNRKLKTL